MSLFHPRIGRYLVSDQGEVVVDQVRKHWAALIVPWIEVAAGGTVLLAALASRPPLAQLLGLLGVALVMHGGWRVLGECRDVFVITNMRVFRVHGILSQQIATMPLTRILDVSVYKPFIGRILGFGNFVFESAAQAQGLREIGFVGHPDRRGLTIQRVITQAGLRGFVSADTGRVVDSAPPPAAATAETIAADHDELAWLTAALRREHDRLVELRGGSSTASVPRHPNLTDTAPMDLPR